ncbi:MAG TPA: HAMP domain-containing sensor histidine kinase [Candidatus Paceibacterota bacterium]|nr:HAMP domain-containing sensor histidine kinase [Candidatus Paceibacterota bacterium]
MGHVPSVGSRLNSTTWIVDARWYYATLAFLLGLITERNVESQGFYDAALFAMYGAILVLNGFFHFVIRDPARTEQLSKHVNSLNMAQIGLDLLFFLVVTIITGSGVESIAHSFFFIPIIVSTILFGFRGAITVAGVSGLFVLITVLINYDFFAYLYATARGFPTENPAASGLLWVELVKAGILFIIYLMTGFFGGYISRLMRARDLLLIEQIEKSEQQVAQLEALTKEFDHSAKLLVRRDLELSNANQKLTQLDQMKSEIISVVAHQLRTPLSAIKWTLKMLVDGDVGSITDEQKTLLEKGYESNERMITLINDMLSVDRLESGKFKYSFVPVQFEELVSGMIEELLPVATQKNVRIEFMHPEKDLQKIKVDPDKMRDVLQNLIDNAVKYSNPGGVVSVRVAEEDNMLHFSVKDAGIGIPQDQQEKIFSRFFRATNAIHMQTDGSGLGLFIAQSVVKRHGGRIWFESAEQTGTTFHVSLPFSQ